MVKILLIESATEVCSVALSIDGVLKGLVEYPESNKHAAVLTLAIDRCLQQEGLRPEALDAIALSKGPGSYTSLRVGAGVAKGMAYALDKPLIAIDTLQALAWAAREHTAHDPEAVFMPMLDARRQEVWYALYNRDLSLLAPPAPLIIEHKLLKELLPQEVSKFVTSVLILSGNGMAKAKNVIFVEGTVFSKIERTSAAYLSMIANIHFKNADFQNIAYFEPFYMKPPNITSPHQV